MNICIINDHFSSGSGGQHRIQNLALGLSKIGHEVIYVSPYGFSSDVFDLDVSHMPSHKSSAPSRFLYPYFNDFFGIFRRLSKLNKKLDLLLIELPNTMSKSLNSIYGPIRHSPVALDIAGLWTSFLSSSIYKNGFIFSIIRQIAGLYEESIARVLPRFSYMVTVPTRGMKILLEKILKRTVHVIPHPIDTVNVFNPDNPALNFGESSNIFPLWLRDKQLIVLGVKDDPRFVSLVEEIVLNYGLREVAFILIGNLPKLKSVSLKKGLDKFMFFTGLRSYVEVPLYISVAKIAVALSVPEVASLYYFPDNLSKIAEYLAMGKPTITNTLGASDYVRNGDDGFISESFEDVAKNIVSLIDKTDLTIQMGKRAREIACEKFDLRQVASKYLETFKSKGVVSR